MAGIRDIGNSQLYFYPIKRLVTFLMAYCFREDIYNDYTGYN